MKNWIVTSLVLFGVQAMGAVSSDVRLEYKTGPIKMSLTEKSTTISLLAGGSVTYSICPTGPQAVGCKQGEITKLTQEEQKSVENAIAAAKKGKLAREIAICEAIPTTNISYTADNSQLMLKQGSVPCGGFVYNDSPEAKELVARLDAWAYGLPLKKQD